MIFWVIIPLIIALIVVVIYQLWPILIFLLLDIPLLYLIYVRAKADILTDEMGGHYLIGLSIALILAFFLRNLFFDVILHPITMILLVMFGIAQVSIKLQNRYEEN